jgi:ABC-2 type transporter
MRSVTSVAGAIALRNLRLFFKNPAIILPALVFPLIFLVGFAGGLSNLSNVPGFDFPSGYTAFQFVFVFLQAAAFGGVFTGFGIAMDFDSGFARRLLLGAPRRIGMLLGYVAAGFVRFLFTASVVTAAALIAGMQVGGDGIELVGLLGLGLIVNLASTFWSAGLSYRFQTLQAAPLMQTPVFIVLFLAPVFVPRTLLDGWIHAVAGFNPITAVLEAGRGLISGDPFHVSLAYLLALAVAALLSLFAVTGLRKAEMGE